MQIRVAVIDDEEAVRETLIDWLEVEANRTEDKVDCVTFPSAESFLNYEGNRFDVVLTDMVMEKDRKNEREEEKRKKEKKEDEEKAGLGVCARLHAKSPILIVLTAHPDYATCVEAMRLGAWDYILKTDDPAKAYRAVYESIKKAFSKRGEMIQVRRENTDATWAQENLDSLIAKDGGKFVAIIDRKVVDSDEDFHALAKRVHERYPYTVATLHSLPVLPMPN